MSCELKGHLLTEMWITGTKLARLFFFFFLRTSGSGALASTPQARWATGQYSNKLGSQGVPRPTLRAGHSSLLLPLLVSPVCQGWREAGAASLLVCVVGVACVSFLVFGPIAVLLP